MSKLVGIFLTATSVVAAVFLLFRFEYYHKGIRELTPAEVVSVIPKGDMEKPVAPEHIPETVNAGVLLPKLPLRDEVVVPEREERRDVCSRNGGRRVNFVRHHKVMWRCVYGRRR